MDRFREIEVFVTVAQEGAFSAAARKIGLSPASLTRLISGLEERLGVRLFNRTTRRVSLTDDGRRFFGDAEHVLQALNAAEAAASGSSDAPTGLLRVTAPTIFGQRHLAPILRDFLDAHPQVRAELLLLDRAVDLIEEGIDVALRIGELPDSSLIAKRIGAVRRVVVAAPSYLDAVGEPKEPSDLRAHQIVHFSGGAATLDWEFVAAGRRTVVRINPRLVTNTLPAALDAARDGWGVARSLSYQVRDDIASGRLVQVLRPFDDRAMPIHFLHAEGRQASPRTRRFIDLAAPRLRSAADADAL
ncbi:MAG: LysR family transcriptional regulator [Pseudomonadota bacterium]